MSMVFKTGFREVMRLDSSGNLGLGVGSDPYEYVYKELNKWPPGSPRFKQAVRKLAQHDLWVAMADSNPVLDDNIYRIRLTVDGIEVICFGLESVDAKLRGHYDGVDDLPDWVKERLAVLMVLDSTPPTGELEGVGRRISEKVFWVYAPTTASGASTSA